ncbi:hypothetical protein F5B20DRAFT_582748 [Whalleya microplaca]|nr:hypothetical protein F5B20DRAFT_582748 [Whalleya microplaca]
MFSDWATLLATWAIILATLTHLSRHTDLIDTPHTRSLAAWAGLLAVLAVGVLGGPGSCFHAAAQCVLVFLILGVLASYVLTFVLLLVYAGALCEDQAALRTEIRGLRARVGVLEGTVVRGAEESGPPPPPYCEGA